MGLILTAMNGDDADNEQPDGRSDDQRDPSGAPADGPRPDDAMLGDGQLAQYFSAPVQGEGASGGNAADGDRGSDDAPVQDARQALRDADADYYHGPASGDGQAGDDASANASADASANAGTDADADAKRQDDNRALLRQNDAYYNEPAAKTSADAEDHPSDRLKFAGSANPNYVNDKVMKTVSRILRRAGVDPNKTYITSTYRTPADQARIMFEQIQSGDISDYGVPGRNVIALYHEQKGKLPDAVVRDNMRRMIQDYYDRGIMVSNHLGDGVNSAVLDLGYKMIPASQRAAIEYELRKAEASGEIIRFHSPFEHDGHKDSTFHLEVPTH